MALPEGFVLDQPGAGLPEGFTLDNPSALAAGAMPVLAIGRGPGTIYGLNVDGSVDREDNGITFAGDNSRDKNFRGIAIPRSTAKAVYGSEKAAMGQPIRVTNLATGLQTTSTVQEIGPAEWTGNIVDLPYAVTHELGGTGKDPMQVELLSNAEGGMRNAEVKKAPAAPAGQAPADVVASDRAFLAANDAGAMRQALPGMIEVRKAIPLTEEEKKSGMAKNRMADDPANVPADDWLERNVFGPASVMPTVAPEYLKLAGASAMKFTGQGLVGLQEIGNEANRELQFQVPEWGKVLDNAPGMAGRWLMEQSKEMRDWADETVVKAGGELAPAIAETVGGIGGFSAVAAVNPQVATMLFAGGTGEELAAKAEQAGRSQEEVAHAREVGAALGLAAAEIPVTRLGKMLEGWNVNPYVKTIAKDLTVVMDKPDMTKRLIASGIEALKSGAIGAATGAGYRVGMNAAENNFTGSNKPLLEGAGADAAMFGIPMAAGGAAARFQASGRPIKFSEFSDRFANPVDGRNADGGLRSAELKRPAAAPETPGAAAAEFQRRAGMSREIVPVERGIVPMPMENGKWRMENGGETPVYAGQNFVDRGGSGPVFQGGSNELAGTTPLAALLPRGVVDPVISNDATQDPGNEIGGWQTRNAELGRSFAQAKQRVDALQDQVNSVIRQEEIALPPGYKTVPYGEQHVALMDEMGNDIAFPLTPYEASERAWQHSGQPERRFENTHKLQAQLSGEMEQAKADLNAARAAWDANGEHPMTEEWKKQDAAAAEATQKKNASIAKAAATRAERKLAKQKAAEVPQEPAPPAKRRRFSTDFISTGRTPLLEWISSEMPIRWSKSGKGGGENDDLPGMDSLRGFFKLVYNKARGDAPDVVAQAAYEMGFIKDPSTNTLGLAMHNEAQSYRNSVAADKRIEASAKSQEKQVKDFSKDALKPKKGKEAVAAASLQPGDKVKIGDEELVVQDIDPETFAVTLEDGKKYGIQQVEHGQVIYADETDLAGGGAGDPMDWPEADRDPFGEIPLQDARMSPEELADAKAKKDRADAIAEEQNRRLIAPEFSIQQDMLGKASDVPLFDQPTQGLRLDEPAGNYGVDSGNGSKYGDVGAVVASEVPAALFEKAPNEYQSTFNFGSAKEGEKDISLAARGGDRGSAAARLAAHRRRGTILGLAFKSLMPEKTGSLVGRKIAGPQHVAEISQIYRDHRFEVLRVYYMDAAGRIVHETAVSARLASTAPFTVAEPGEYSSFVKEIRRTLASVGAKKFCVVHNHPSGDPKPSGAGGDVDVTVQIGKDFPKEFLYHVIINSGKYAVVTKSGDGHIELLNGGRGVNEHFENPHVSHAALGNKIAGVEDIAEVAKGVELAKDGFVLIGTDNQLRARVIMSSSEWLLQNPKEMAGLCSRLARVAGVRYIMLGGMRTESLYRNEAMLKDAQRQGFILDVVSRDGINLGGSNTAGKQMGRGWAAGQFHGKAIAFYETPEKYRPATPVAVHIAGSKWVPKEMAHLDKIKPGAMPEIVRLARELTGKVPELAKMRPGPGGGKVLGRAGGIEGVPESARIRLDPGMFVDPSLPAKVLAHEIGHIGDFLPEGTLRRGNILGRLAVLRDFLGATLPIDPESGTKSLTAKDRAKIRREAEKAVGGRPAADNEADLAAWQAEVQVKYFEMVQDEMDARGLAYSGKRDYLPNVREELISLTDWWNPFLDHADGLPETYLKYRTSSKELYAEMISVLLNDPAALKQRAPTAWDMFFNHLDKKPDAKRALFELWDWMNKPEAERLAERRAGVLGAFRSGAELMARKIAARERLWTTEGFVDGIRTFLDTRYWPAIRRERAAAVRGDVPAQQGVLEWLFDSHPLADNQVFLWLDGVQKNVRGPLLEKGLTEEDLGEFLMWDRIANERYEITQDIGNGMREVVGEGGRAVIANPGGHNPETAIKQIEYLEQMLGPEKFAALRGLADRFHEEFFKLTSAMNDEGMLKPETWEMVRNNKEHYAAFVPLEYADTFVTAAIRKQIGTLKDIANPYVSTVLKGITTIRAIEMNRVKRTMIDNLRRMFPGEIEPAKMRFDGKGQVAIPPKDPELGMLTIARDGKRESYYAPGDIVEMFDREDHSLLAQVVGPLDYLWRNVFYPIFITYNPVFQFLRNPIRDTRRTALNLPHGVGVEQAAVMRLVNAKQVRAFVEKGIISPDIAAALEARVITPPMGTWQATSGAVDEFTAIARRFGLAPEVKGVWDRNALLRPIAAVGERIRIAGQVRELVPKVGTFKLLTGQLGWGPDEAAYFVRNHIGTPNYTKQGTMTRVANDIFPFTNIFLKGWQSDLRLMRRGYKGKGTKPRKSAASWWMRWMLTSGSLRVLQAAGAAGLLGAGIKALYDRVGDYWLTNYDVLPVGDTDGGKYDGKKTAFLAIPRDPTDRILSALTYTFAKAAFDTAMGQKVDPAAMVPKGFSMVSSDVPGMNPAIKIASGWRQFLAGQNPYDSFRAAPVLTDRQQLAGGWPAVKTMLAWTVQQSGAMNFVQYDPSSGSSLEIGVGMVPGINGLLKVSDNGLREKINASNKAEDKVRAQAGEAMPGIVQELYREYNWLQSVGADKRNPMMEARYQTLSGWHREIYKPFLEAAAAAPRAQGRIGETAAALSKPFKQRAR